MACSTCTRSVVRFALASAIVSLAAAAADAAGAAPSASVVRTRSVPCSEAIDRTTFPYIGNRERLHRYRLVLAVASVPPAYQGEAVPTRDPTWPYFRKAGLVIRASAQTVVVTVPKAWRTRAAIAWG